MATAVRSTGHRPDASSPAKTGDGIPGLHLLAAWLLSVAENALGQCTDPSSSDTLEIDALSRRLAETKRRFAHLSKLRGASVHGRDRKPASSHRSQHGRKFRPMPER